MKKKTLTKKKRCELSTKNKKVTKKSSKKVCKGPKVVPIDKSIEPLVDHLKEMSRNFFDHLKCLDLSFTDVVSGIAKFNNAMAQNIHVVASKFQFLLTEIKCLNEKFDKLNEKTSTLQDLEVNNSEKISRVEELIREYAEMILERKANKD